MTRTLAVVVPAFNEERSVGETIKGLRGLESALLRLGVHLRIYLVDDGSSDGTRHQAEEAGVDRFIAHRTNQGLGAAVRSGLRAARVDRADIVVKFDADLQHDPADIPALIEPILSGEADIVYGNRFERIEYRMPFVRRVGNLVFSRLMRALTGWPLADSQPGILAINQDYLEVFSLPGDYNYTQQLLLDAFHKHMRFAHVPVSFRKRESGRSFVSLGYPLKVLPQIVMVIVSVKPLRIFAPIGLAFLGLASSVFVVQVVFWTMGLTPRPVENVNLVLGAGLFGVQTLFFGILAQLIVQSRA